MKGIQNFLLALPLLLSSFVSLSVTRKLPSTEAHLLIVKGIISHYKNQPLTLFKCYEDTLLLVDSLRTDEMGKFAFTKAVASVAKLGLQGLFKIQLQRNQFFYFLRQNEGIQIHTIYSNSPMYNLSSDSLEVTWTEQEGEKTKGSNDPVINQQFYRFQHLQQELNVANYFLKEMMRLFPLADPFHKKMEDEYMKRNHLMEKFVNQQIFKSPEMMSTKIARAYFQPVLPDWKLPDPVGDSILAKHYFDEFDPADTFYLHSNVLPEKMGLYLSLRTNKKNQFGQPIQEEQQLSQAAYEFLGKTKSITESGSINHPGTYPFCLNYFLKMFRKEHKEKAFLALYDSTLQAQNGDCGTKELDRFSWARDYASRLKGTLIGAVAPDFYLEKDGLKLSSLKSDYILLVFWASWCPHCAQLLPQVRDLVEPVREKISTVAISVDSDTTQWKIFVKDNQLTNWLNTSELKGWQGVTPKRYNIYATPSLFLLDRERKILAKPADATELKAWIDKIR